VRIAGGVLGGARGGVADPADVEVRGGVRPARTPVARGALVGDDGGGRAVDRGGQRARRVRAAGGAVDPDRVRVPDGVPPPPGGSRGAARLADPAVLRTDGELRARGGVAHERGGRSGGRLARRRGGAAETRPRARVAG